MSLPVLSVYMDTTITCSAADQFVNNSLHAFGDSIQAFFVVSLLVRL